MFVILLAVAAAIWFALIYPLAVTRLRLKRPVLDVPWGVAFLLVTSATFVTLVFNVEREDGNAVLEQGLTASNKVVIAITFVTALYILFRVLIKKDVLFLPFSMPYLPMTLMMVWDAMSIFWSIVPSYTIYRLFELVVLSLATMMIFDRSDIEHRLGTLLSYVILVWLAATAAIWVPSMAHGIVFSSAKNNMMPLVCGALMLLALFEPSTPRRWRSLVLGFVGFVVAGSASSTGAFMAALGPAILIASPRWGHRILGWVLAAVFFAIFTVLMFGLANFPILLTIASTVMQKPPVELVNATGRDEFWPLFIQATHDRVFGSGFAAGDRFLQLLIPVGDFAYQGGKSAIELSSAHNMFLSAWSSTGMAGLGFCVVVVGQAFQWGLKLDSHGRRFVTAFILMMVLNSMTTPGIFQIWSANNLAFIAVLAYVRIGVMRRDGLGRDHKESWSGHRAAWAVGAVPNLSVRRAS